MFATATVGPIGVEAIIETSSPTVAQSTEITAEQIITLLNVLKILIEESAGKVISEESVYHSHRYNDNDSRYGGKERTVNTCFRPRCLCKALIEGYCENFIVEKYGEEDYQNGKNGADDNVGHICSNNALRTEKRCTGIACDAGCVFGEHT